MIAVLDDGGHDVVFVEDHRLEEQRLHVVLTVIDSVRRVYLSASRQLDR